MPKRKVTNSTSTMPKIVAALFRVRELHSPCVSENCPIDYRHCAGCNEAYPCLTVHALEGTSPKREAVVTILGDQELPEGSEETVISSSFEPTE